MSSKTRSASVTRPTASSSNRSSSSVATRSQNILATVHSPEVVRSINNTTIDQSRFPILSGSVDNNNRSNEIPSLMSDSSPGANITSQLNSASTDTSSSSSASQNNISSSSMDSFSSPLPYNPTSSYSSSSNSSSSSDSSSSSSSAFVSSSKNEISSFLSQDQFNQFLQMITTQHDQRMLTMEKELSQLRTENI